MIEAIRVPPQLLADVGKQGAGQVNILGIDEHVSRSRGKSHRPAGNPLRQSAHAGTKGHPRVPCASPVVTRKRDASTAAAAGTTTAPETAAKASRAGARAHASHSAQPGAGASAGARHASGIIGSIAN